MVLRVNGCFLTHTRLGGGLGAGEPDGGAVVVEVRAPALFVCLGGGIEEAHSCEVVHGYLLYSKQEGYLGINREHFKKQLSTLAHTRSPCRGG